MVEVSIFCPPTGKLQRAVVEPDRAPQASLPTPARKARLAAARGATLAAWAGHGLQLQNPDILPPLSED